MVPVASADTLLSRNVTGTLGGGLTSMAKEAVGLLMTILMEFAVSENVCPTCQATRLVLVHEGYLRTIPPGGMTILAFQSERDSST